MEKKKNEIKNERFTEKRTSKNKELQKNEIKKKNERAKKMRKMR